MKNLHFEGLDLYKDDGIKTTTAKLLHFLPMVH